jgi:hypothetical protein
MRVAAYTGGPRVPSALARSWTADVTWVWRQLLSAFAPVSVLAEA